MSAQDAYTAQVMGALNPPEAYYLCNSTSGVEVDIANGDDATLIDPSGFVTRDLDGPFSGAKSIRFQLNATNGSYFEAVIGSRGIGDTCRTFECWMLIESFSIVGAAGAFGLIGGVAYMTAGMHADLGGSPNDRKFRWGSNSGAVSHDNYTTTAVPVGEWHYTRIQRLAPGVGENIYFLDDQDVTPAVSFSGLTTPYGEFRFGLAFQDYASGSISLRLSNVAFYRECPVPPIMFPPPEDFVPQIYRRLNPG